MQAGKAQSRIFSSRGIKGIVYCIRFSSHAFCAKTGNGEAFCLVHTAPYELSCSPLPPARTALLESRLLAKKIPSLCPALPLSPQAIDVISSLSAYQSSCIPSRQSKQPQSSKYRIPKLLSNHAVLRAAFARRGPAGTGWM